MKNHRATVLYLGNELGIYRPLNASPPHQFGTGKPCLQRLRLLFFGRPIFKNNIFVSSSKRRLGGVSAEKDPRPALPPVSLALLLSQEPKWGFGMLLLEHARGTLDIRNPDTLRGAFASSPRLMLNWQNFSRRL